MQLTRRELLQLFGGLVQRRGRRILLLAALLRFLAALHRLVLVPQPVLLQFEDIGEVRRICAATTTTAATTTATLLLLNLDFAEHRFGATEFRQRLLLVAQRATLRRRDQLLLG